MNLRHISSNMNAIMMSAMASYAIEYTNYILFCLFLLSASSSSFMKQLYLADDSCHALVYIHCVVSCSVPAFSLSHPPCLVVVTQHIFFILSPFCGPLSPRLECFISPGSEYLSTKPYNNTLSLYFSTEYKMNYVCLLLGYAKLDSTVTEYKSPCATFFLCWK